MRPPAHAAESAPSNRCGSGCCARPARTRRNCSPARTGRPKHCWKTPGPRPPRSSRTPARQGEADAAQGRAAELTRVRRTIRARNIDIRRQAYEELGRGAEQVGGLRHRPDYPAMRDRLARRARQLLGPDCEVAEHPSGGIVARAPGRRASSPWMPWPPVPWTGSARRRRPCGHRGQRRGHRHSRRRPGATLPRPASGRSPGRNGVRGRYRHVRRRLPRRSRAARRGGGDRRRRGHGPGVRVHRRPGPRAQRASPGHAAGRPPRPRSARRDLRRSAAPAVRRWRLASPWCRRDRGRRGRRWRFTPRVAAGEQGAGGRDPGRDPGNRAGAPADSRTARCRRRGGADRPRGRVSRGRDRGRRRRHRGTDDRGLAHPPSAPGS